MIGGLFSDAHAARFGSSRKQPVPQVAAQPGVVVEDATCGFVGEVIAVEKQPGGFVMILEDRHRARRSFPLGPGYLIDGQPVCLVRAGAATVPPTGRRTASGSIAVHGQRARVAQQGRIYVEGSHDAQLVERVWGDDLRVVGVVVEYLQGIDDLPQVVHRFAPGPQRRLGVLVDHLVPGSKESRLAAQITDAHTLVVGHPFIDVWQAVRPASAGIASWPHVPRGQDWKTGVCQVLHASDPAWPVEPPQAWRHLLARVNSYADLEPALLGRVEQLIDFVTVGGSGNPSPWA